MTLSELIQHVGDDNVLFQNLDSDSEGCNIRGSKGTFTFRTDPKHIRERLLGEPRYVGIVVWLPKNRLPEDMK